MTILFFRRPIACSRTRNGERSELSVSRVEFHALKQGQEAPDDDLVRSVKGAMTLEDGATVNESELRQLDLANGIRNAVRPFFGCEPV